MRDFERWPEWWPGVEEVSLDGDEMEQVWRSRLPYAVRFRAHVERIEAPDLIEGTVEGALRGHGVCRLSEAPEGTRVDFQLDVETTEPWMNVLAPLARRIFAWNHDELMRRGGEGIAGRLGTTVDRAGSVGRRSPG